MDVIKYPVICFEKDFFRIRYNEESLTTTTRAGLKNGLFTNLFIIDSMYRGFKVKSAQKLYGVGLFGGYNIFLNQKIKVELLFEGEPQEVSLDEIKKRIIQSFRKWDGWKAGGHLQDLITDLKIAKSFEDIISIFKEIL